MASKLSFGGIYTSVPGAYSRVDRSGLAVFSPLATGVLALVGECEGGGGGGGTVVQTFDNPQEARDAIRSGPLLDMSLLAFDPSNDERMGGARQVLAVKINPSAPSIVTMANLDGDALLVTSQESGLFTSQINVEKAAGGVLGSAFIETFESTTNLYDDLGGVAWFTLLYTAGSYTAMAATVGVDASGNPDKVTAAGTLLEAAGEASATAFAAGERVTIPASAGANVGKIVTVYGINSDGEPDTEDLTLDGEGGYAPAGNEKHWQRVTAATIDVGVAGANVLIQDESGSTELTMAFAAATTTIGRRVLTSVPVANRPISLASDGATTDPIVVRGLDIAGNTRVEAVTLNNALAVISTESWSRIDSLEIGGLPAARSLTMTTAAVDARNTSTTGAATSRLLSATQVGAFNLGDRAEIVSAAAGDTSLTVRIWGLDAAGDYQTEDLVTDATAGTTRVTGTLTWSAVFGGELIGGVYPTGIITISDEVPTTVQSIVATRLESGVLAGATSGIHGLRIPVANTTITLVSDGATTRSVLVEGLDTAGAAQREVIALTGAAAVTTAESWSRIDAVYTGDVEAARTVAVGSTYTIPGGYTTIQQLADAYNARDGFTATVVTTAPLTNLISELDILSAAGAAAARDILGITVDFDADLTEMIRRVNAQSSLVTLSRPDGATTVPTNTLVPAWLTGGSEGVSTNAHWIVSFGTTLPGTSLPLTIVPLSSSAAVAALLDAALIQREGAQKREADGKVGLASLVTKANAQAALQAIASRRISGYGQDIKRYNAAGTLTWFPPYAQAVLAAGMQAGAATVGEPLTRKFAKVVDVRQSSTWDPIADADDMLDMGLCFLEEVSGKGFRWVRGITTWLADDNLGSTEQSVNHAVNVFVRNLRDGVDAIIGAVNFAGTEAACKGVVRAQQERALSAGEITAFNPATFTQTADQIKISMEIVPPIPWNFAPIDVHLVLELS